MQLVDHICDAAIFMSDDELHDLSWSSFVSAIKEPELVQYLKERNLYVNEPVEVEEKSDVLLIWNLRLRP